MGFNSWVGGSAGEGNDNPLQYSRLGNPMDRVAWWDWWDTVPGVTRVGHDLVTKPPHGLSQTELKVGSADTHNLQTCRTLCEATDFGAK